MLGLLVLPACTRSELLALVALLIVGLTNIIRGSALGGLRPELHACEAPFNEPRGTFLPPGI